MPLTIQFIRESATKSVYELSLHADQERLEEGLTVAEMEEALQEAELLEDYPADPRGPSSLVLGHTKGRSVHVVCGCRNSMRMS